MTPAWKKNFTVWLRMLIRHFRSRGLSYDQFALYPFDEILDKDFYDLAKVIKAADPNVRIFANYMGKGPKDFMRCKDLVDIWCIRDQLCLRYPGWVETIRGFGKEMWTYEALGPGKANHPYSYYRLLPWRAFKRGQTGAGFWKYEERVKTKSWDDENAVGQYAVVYGSYNSPVNTFGEIIIPSKRWEAWREGIEDYQYLYELQKVINAISDNNPEKASKLQDILNNQVEYVLQRPNNCDAVYKARQTISTHLKSFSPN